MMISFFDLIDIMTMEAVESASGKLVENPGFEFVL